MNAEAEHDMNRYRIDIEKIRAEITNLIADTRKIEDEREKLRAEAREMWTKARWYPIVVAAALLGAGAGLAKLFLQS